MNLINKGNPKDVNKHVTGWTWKQYLKDLD